MSYIRIAAATEALRLLTCPFIGSETISSQFSRTKRDKPKPSLPTTKTTLSL